MSARLVSRKPRPYASFVAVSISRARLSGCAVRIFSNSQKVSYLTNSDHKPNASMLSTPATRQFRALVDGGPIHKRFVGQPEMRKPTNPRLSSSLATLRPFRGCVWRHQTCCRVQSLVYSRSQPPCELQQ